MPAGERVEVRRRFVTAGGSVGRGAAGAAHADSLPYYVPATARSPTAARIRSAMREPVKPTSS